MSQYPDERLLMLALQQKVFGYPVVANELLQHTESVTEIYANSSRLSEILPDASPTLLRVLHSDWTPQLRRAEEELLWCEKKQIRVLLPSDASYPRRLLDCPDAPLALFYRGNADLNAAHVIAVVGTRQSTPYGHDIIHNLMSDLQRQLPDTLVVSGLAYGIDSCAHRESLDHSLPTVGVLAHGLDTIYPAAHRSLATKMLDRGGLITEYMSKTKGDRANFIRRNRIIAGMADTVIVVESKSHGGSLSTARIANDYGRDVATFPGRVGDVASAGCNILIRENKARLVTSTEDIIDGLGWVTISAAAEIRRKGVEMPLFQDFTPDQQLIVNALREGDMQQNMLCVKTGLPPGKVCALLFQLEMSGYVKPYAGGTYHLRS
ncbi:MAG: DNA-processing protein DprA [Prevotella sp.]|nr:DNA-processing protein DprA [Prevotella sp.]MDY5034182.1 DNA-processing protein DprA [Prevotella sp.]